MKRRILFYWVIGFVLLSCETNQRPGLSDKVLLAQLNEADSLQQLIRSTDFPEPIVISPPPGVKYGESRAVNPANPPFVFDLANRNLNIKNFSVGDYYSQATYIKIKHPLPLEEGNFLFDAAYIFSNDRSSVSGRGLHSQFSFTENYIEGGDVFFGYHRYDWNGNFLYTDRSFDFEKVYDVSLNRISYNWDDYWNAVKEIFANRSTNNRVTVDDETTASYVYNRRDTVNDKFLITFGLRGDTLCVFKNYNPKPTRKGPPISWQPPTRSYFYKGTYTIQQAMNDTVFRLTAPDRLEPVFVFNYGSHKLDASLADAYEDKFFPDKWIETDKYILITYNKDRDFPINRERGGVTFFYSYFDKQTRQYYHFNEGTTTPEQEFFMENTVPDGLPFMMSSARIEHNQLWVCYNKKRLENLIKSKGFASLPSEKQDKLKTEFDNLVDNEVLIMFLK